tara:strand:+ start:4929 stop:5165 length:237 start_codon:yes stop_codon:yes gene_type:complete
MSNIENRLLKCFDQVFEEIDTSSFNLNTNFKENNEWDSMCALSLIAAMDNEFKIEITGEQINEMKSINDLLKFIKDHE